MNFTTTAPDRKKLVKTIAEHFELDPAYNGPPTFSYKVGDITIEDEKTAARLQAFLIEKGWMEPAPAASAAETEPDLVGPVMDIGCPLREMTVLSLTNLIHIKSNSDWKFVHVYTEMLTPSLIQIHPTCTQIAPKLHPKCTQSRKLGAFSWGWLSYAHKGFHGSTATMTNAPEGGIIYVQSN